jgi:hypothetical protein
MRTLLKNKNRLNLKFELRFKCFDFWLAMLEKKRIGQVIGCRRRSQFVITLISSTENSFSVLEI